MSGNVVPTVRNVRTTTAGWLSPGMPYRSAIIPKIRRCEVEL